LNAPPLPTKREAWRSVRSLPLFETVKEPMSPSYSSLSSWHVYQSPPIFFPVRVFRPPNLQGQGLSPPSPLCFPPRESNTSLPVRYSTRAFPTSGCRGAPLNVGQSAAFSPPRQVSFVLLMRQRRNDFPGYPSPPFRSQRGGERFEQRVFSLRFDFQSRSSSFFPTPGSHSHLLKSAAITMRWPHLIDHPLSLRYIPPPPSSCCIEKRWTSLL